MMCSNNGKKIIKHKEGIKYREITDDVHRVIKIAFSDNKYIHINKA